MEVTIRFVFLLYFEEKKLFSYVNTPFSIEIDHIQVRYDMPISRFTLNVNNYTESLNSLID